MTPQTVRLAPVHDAAAIARIHSEGIADRIATFETEPRTVAQVTAAMTEQGDRYLPSSLSETAR